MKVLVVEDDANLETLLVSVFEEAGHEVTGVTDAKKARNILLTSQFDVVVLDLHLGDESGLSIATLSTYTNPNCRIVMITGSSLFANGELFELAPTITSILRKPVHIDELLAVSEHCVMAH